MAKELVQLANFGLCAVIGHDLQCDKTVCELKGLLVFLPDWNEGVESVIMLLRMISKIFV